MKGKCAHINLLIIFLRGMGSSPVEILFSELFNLGMLLRSFCLISFIQATIPIQFNFYLTYIEYYAHKVRMILKFHLPTGIMLA